MSYEKSSISYLSDGELVMMYKNTSDKKFIGELYKRYTHLVYGACLHYLGDENLAQEAVIQIFEKLFDDLKIHEVNNFKGWLSFVIRNFCISQLRKMEILEIKKQKFEEEIKSASPPESEEAMEIQEIKIHQLEKALKLLSPFQKKCLELFYGEQLSYNQIVENTGLSLNKVKSHIQNGKQKLKQLLIKSK